MIKKRDPQSVFRIDMQRPDIDRERLFSMLEKIVAKRFRSWIIGKKPLPVDRNPYYAVGSLTDCIGLVMDEGSRIAFPGKRFKTVRMDIVYRNTQIGSDPKIPVLIVAQGRNVYRLKSEFLFGIVPESRSIEPAQAGRGPEPDKALFILNDLVDHVVGQSAVRRGIMRELVLGRGGQGDLTQNEKPAYCDTGYFSSEFMVSTIGQDMQRLFHTTWKYGQ